MSDLDDFFAKKDKKKGKAKPKFILTPEEVTQKIEETRERGAAALKAMKLEASAAAGAAAAGDDDKEKPVPEEQVTEEEWKEFEEERRKDYSGLKIGQLTLKDKDEDDESPAEGDYDDDGERDGNSNPEQTKRSGGGVWKHVIPAEQVTQIPMEVEKPRGGYIPPALRQSQNAAPRISKRNRTAPDITNADFFPTLGAARPEEQRKKKNEPAFEEVRHGGRIQRIQDGPATAHSAATNRFQTLDEDDS